MYSVFVCRNCGAEYGEAQDDNLCLSCYENEVFNSDYVLDYWEDENY